MTVFQAILEKIKAYDTIIIHRHQRPDPDAIGSQVGLKEILKTNFPDKKVLATGVNEPTLSWIAEMDEVPDNDYEGALVIVTDTANTPRIDDDRYDKAQVRSLFRTDFLNLLKEKQVTQGKKVLIKEIFNEFMKYHNHSMLLEEGLAIRGHGKYKTAGLLKMSSAISNIKNGQTSSKSAHVIFIDLLIECYQKHYDVEGIVHFV